MTMPSVGVTGRGYGDNSNVLDQTIMASRPNGGFVADIPLLLTSWRDKDLAALAVTPGSTPYFAFPYTGLPAIVWLYSAAATDIIRNTIVIPREYDPQVDQLYFTALLEKGDTVDENADLAMQLMVRQHLAGTINPALAAAAVPSGDDISAGETAVSSLSAVIKRTLPAASAVLAGIRKVQFDIGSDKRGTLTNGLRIVPGDTVTFEFGPDDTVGSSDMYVAMYGCYLTIVRNACFHNWERRFTMDGGKNPSTARYGQASRFID